MQGHRLIRSHTIRVQGLEMYQGLGTGEGAWRRNILAELAGMVVGQTGGLESAPVIQHNARWTSDDEASLKCCW